MPCPISGFFDDDRDDVVGRDLDEGVGHEGRPPGACGACANTPVERIEIGGDHHAAAGQRGDLEEGATIERASLSMASSYSLPRCAPSAARARRHRRGLVNRLADAEVGAAAADVAVHRAIDVRVARLRRRRQQRRGRHDLARLAVAALRDVDLLPRDLQRMRAVRRQPFERRDRRVRRRRHRRLAGAHRAAAQVHRARAALPDAAAELGALQVQDVANHPQQGHVRRHVHRRRASVHVQCVRHRCFGLSVKN